MSEAKVNQFVIDLEAEEKRPRKARREKGAVVKHARLCVPGGSKVSAMRLSSILGRYERSLALAEKVLRVLGIVKGSGKNRKGPSESAVKMRHRADAPEWYCPKAQLGADGKPGERYRMDAQCVLEIASRVKEGQDFATIKAEMGIDVEEPT